MLACVPLHAEPSEKRAPGVTPALTIETVWRYYTGVALSQLAVRSQIAEVVGCIA